MRKILLLKVKIVLVLSIVSSNIYADSRFALIEIREEKIFDTEFFNEAMGGLFTGSIIGNPLLFIPIYFVVGYSMNKLISYHNGLLWIENEKNLKNKTTQYIDRELSLFSKEYVSIDELLKVDPYKEPEKRKRVEKIFTENGVEYGITLLIDYDSFQIRWIVKDIHNRNIFELYTYSDSESPIKEFIDKFDEFLREK